jgi:hypothetical protein
MTRLVRQRQRRLRATPRPDPADHGATTLGSRIRDLATVIAPTTVLTALMVYFGVVATRARFDYFGVYLELTDLSNQDLVLYGFEALYVPAALVLLAALTAAVLHAGVTWLLSEPAHRRLCLVIAGGVALSGALLVARALIGILVPGVAQQETPGTTPLALAVGPLLAAYGGWIAARCVPPRDPSRARFAAWYDSSQVHRLRRLAAVATVALVVAGLFWATNSFAWAFGQGRAYDDALKLPRQPEVVLDTKESLGDVADGVSETSLSTDKEASFRYRYHGFRLLLEGGGRLFLVPRYWTEDSRTLVVAYDSTVRLQLIPIR